MPAIFAGSPRFYSMGATAGASNADLVMVSAIDRTGNESFRAISKIDPIGSSECINDCVDRPGRKP